MWNCQEMLRWLHSVHTPKNYKNKALKGMLNLFSFTVNSTNWCPTWTFTVSSVHSSPFFKKMQVHIRFSCFATMNHRVLQFLFKQHGALNSQGCGEINSWPRCGVQFEISVAAHHTHLLRKEMTMKRFALQKWSWNHCSFSDYFKCCRCYSPHLQ